MTSADTIPVGTTDPVNAAILSISEDGLQGFHPEPFAEISRRAGLPAEEVVTRLRAMLEAGTIRRIRQTCLTTRLAAGSLVAWQIPESRLHSAFDFMFQEDPFSGHVVIRTADPATPGANYRLWTTLKVPQGYSLEAHARYLAGEVGASRFRLMPARALFTLGVGHVRRRGMEPGSRAQRRAEPVDSEIATLSPGEWRVLTELKREFAPNELRVPLWERRAAATGLSLEAFCNAAAALDSRGLLGRFSTFLEHVKPVAGGERVTRYNALFHWAVPPGQELLAGGEVGRHHIMTHAYWREGGPEFRNVNVMGVAHGTDKDLVLAHKVAIDEHLADTGVEVFYTNVFWGGRSEIKPSEISPVIYEQWCREQGLDPDAMRDTSEEPGR